VFWEPSVLRTATPATPEAHYRWSLIASAIDPGARPADAYVREMAVPEPLVPQVTRLLHEYFTGGATANASDSVQAVEAASAEQAVAVPGNGSWTRGELEELHASFRNDKGRAVIARIAERSLADEAATYGELQKHAGLDEFKLRSQFAWFSKKGKALKGTKGGVWPMTVTDAGSQSAKGVRYRYQMPKQIAAWWLELSEADS
jgi:hypothetical protein